MSDSNDVEAKVIADSVNARRRRLTTVQVTHHRFVLSEENTHRVFSRGSASSRAIPVRKQIERVKNNPAIPLSFPLEKKGMQGGEEMSGASRISALSEWKQAAQAAVSSATYLSEIGLHKSVVNRLLEPFMMHTVIISSTAWENFFRQRCHPMAQPEMRAAAEAIQRAIRTSTPVLKAPGDPHLPYILPEDRDWARDRVGDNFLGIGLALAPVSAARCARVSYLTQEGKRDHEEDLNLYRRLVDRSGNPDDPEHFSPLEHVAFPEVDNEHAVHVRSVVDPSKSMTLTLPKYGNFLGWQQLRIQVEMERHYQSFS